MSSTGGSLYNFWHRRDGRLSLYHRQHRRPASAGHHPQARRDGREGESGATGSRRSRATSPCRWRCFRHSARWRCWCSSARSQPSQFNLFNGATVVPTLATLVSLTAGTMFLVWLGETDHRERHRQRHLAHHLRQHHGASIPQTHRLAALVSSSGTGGSLNNGGLSAFWSSLIALGLAMIFVMVMVYHGAAACAGAVSRRSGASSRWIALRPRDDLHPVAGQQRGHDSADLRQLDPAAADGHRELHADSTNTGLRELLHATCASGWIAPTGITG